MNTRANLASASLVAGLSLLVGASLPISAEETSGLDVFDDPPEAVLPMELLEQVADAHAFQLWGDNVARGRPIPLADASGKTFSYTFPYLRGSNHFPDDELIFSAVRELRSGNASSQRAFGGEFGAVQVSATRRSFPVLMASFALPTYFAQAEAAQQLASHQLGESTTLERIYFLGPHEEYLEFVTRNDRILVHAHGDALTAHEPDAILSNRRVGRTSDDMLNRINSSWAEVEQFAPENIDADEVGRTHTTKRIPYWRLVPVINWTYWCVPTANAMLAGFWDNYARGVGTITGYGRIIDYWFEHSSGNNVPNFIDEIIDPTLKHPTWSAAAFLGTLNTTNQYNFNWQQVKNTPDQTWNIIKREIDNGRPAMWSVTDHSMPAIGYRIAGSQKFVMVYTTWGKDQNEQLRLYNHEYWSVKKMGESVVGVLKPGGGMGNQHAALIEPYGNQTIMMPYDIKWYVWGDLIKQTQLSYSRDGGKNWTTIATLRNTGPGINSYKWSAETATSKGRIRIETFADDGTYIAGDGSRYNFYVWFPPPMSDCPVGQRCCEPWPTGGCLECKPDGQACR